MIKIFRKQFTFVELTCVIVLLSIIGSGAAFLVAELSSSALLFRQVVEDTQDQNYGLMRLTKELNIHSPNITITSSGFTLGNPSANIASASWDSGAGQLFVDGKVMLDKVSHFHVGQDGKMVTIELGINDKTPVSTTVMIRE